MIRPGEMVYQVVIAEQSTTQDAYGEQIATWVTFVTRRAAIERSPGGEVWASAQRNARIPTVFRLRYHAGILPGMRLTCDSKTYNILSVVPDAKTSKRELLITTQELVAE